MNCQFHQLERQNSINIELDVLKIISESSYEIEGGPKELNRKKIDGSITRKKLLQKLDWGQKGNTRLLGITNRLEKAGLINKIPYTETFANRADKWKTIFEDGYSKRVIDETIQMTGKYLQIIGKQDMISLHWKTPSQRRFDNLIYRNPG